MNTDEKNEKGGTFIQAAGPSSILPAYKFQISDYISSNFIILLLSSPLQYR